MQPECLFATFLFMHFCCLFSVALAVYIRYREVEEIEKTMENNENVGNLNKKSLWLGFIASFGVSIVGNFQETNVFAIHVLGAFLAFGLGTVYICLQVRR